MERRTVEVYERSALSYAARRRANHPGRAESFAAAVADGGLRLDLGCGPGHYLPYLGHPVVAADAAVAMVAEVRGRHPRVPVVACDLEALPFRRGGLAGAWASKCLQHVAPERLPMALAGLHRALAPGGVLDLTLFSGDGQSRTGDDDDFPGRFFAWWRPGALRRVLLGAGFDVDELEELGKGDIRRIVARARRARTLPDTVGPGMRLLVVGLNPSLYAADAGVGFARPGNRFWRAAREAGLVTTAGHPDQALRRHGLGMTDMVKRATVAAADLTPGEYRAGFGRIEHLVAWLAPRAVVFVGLAGWRAAVARCAAPGVQPTALAGVPVYVMPSTSGLNARTSLGALVSHLRAAADLAARR